MQFGTRGAIDPSLENGERKVKCLSLEVYKEDDSILVQHITCPGDEVKNPKICLFHIFFMKV